MGRSVVDGADRNIEANEDELLTAYRPKRSVQKSRRLGRLSVKLAAN
jgi:hypothetical protein